MTRDSDLMIDCLVKKIESGVFIQISILEWKLQFLQLKTESDVNFYSADMKIFCVSADFRFFPDPRIFSAFFILFIFLHFIIMIFFFFFFFFI